MRRTDTIVRLGVARRKGWEIYVAALAIALITLIIAGMSYFDRDDLFFASYFQLNPPTPSVLVRSWFGHLMPGYIASVLAFLAVFSLSWPAAMVLTALIHTGAFIALVRCLDALSGPARLNAFVGAAFSLSLGPLAVRLWWAATLNNMFALALGLAVLGCATRWFVTHRRRHLIAALLLYALALALSEKNLLFSVHIGAWFVLVVLRGLSARERIAAIGRSWLLWVGLVLISLVDVIAFLSGQYVEESGSAPGLLFSLEFIVHSVVGGLVPSLFGVQMAGESTDLLDARVLIASLLAAAFVIWTVVRDRSNAGVWVFALVAVVANAAVLSRRGEMIGLDGSRQLRYLLESSALLWLAIGVVLLSALRAGSPSGVSSEGGWTNRIIRTLAGTVAVAAVVTSTWFWVSNLTNAIRQSGGVAARAWVTSLQSTLPHPAPPLIDSPLPETFGMPALHPYDMVAALLPSLGWQGVRTTNDPRGAWVVGPDGTAGPAIMASPDVQFSGNSCSDGSANIPMPAVRTSGRTFIRVDVSEGSGDSITLLVRNGWTTVARPPEGGAVVIYLADPVEGDLQISSQGGSMCVERVTVGDMLPEPAAAGR